MYSITYSSAACIVSVSCKVLRIVECGSFWHWGTRESPRQLAYGMPTQPEKTRKRGTQDWQLDPRPVPLVCSWVIRLLFIYIEQYSNIAMYIYIFRYTRMTARPYGDRVCLELKNSKIGYFALFCSWLIFINYGPGLQLLYVSFPCFLDLWRDLAFRVYRSSG